MATTNAPNGILLIECCLEKRCRRSKTGRDIFYRGFILVFTFLCYTAYHLSRKPLSVVKNVLNQNCSGLTPPPGTIVTNGTEFTWCNWAPFNGTNSNELMGTLDSAFLFSYAFAMFFSGPIAERVDLRYFLSIGMLLSGIFTYLFGLAYVQNIHALWYFVAIQILGGIVQSSGWPSVVTCLGNWFGKGRRGFIFGIWNSHTSVGNILGSIIAGMYVQSNWGYSFMIPGAIISVVGFLVFLFLVVYPEDIGCSEPTYHDDSTPSSALINASRRSLSSHQRRNCSKSHGSNDELSELEDSSQSSNENDHIESGNSLAYEMTKSRHAKKLLSKYSKTTAEEEQRLISNARNGADETYSTSSSYGSKDAITFTGALRIPGVIEFSLCLFFAKLVSYTFLYWLPKYINMSMHSSANKSAYLSTLFDVGGILGGIVAGVISDHTGASASTCTAMLVIAIPMLFIYHAFGYLGEWTNIGLMMACGLFVNGPYALITTAVSAELGTHKSLKGNSKAVATVTSIIDGTGSLGAAIGPLLAGIVSPTGWTNVFYLLMAADVFAVLLLLRLVKREIFRKIKLNKRRTMLA